ncbi:PREDICTED: sodium-coupled monocarboxylate transporter 1-like [Dinoponera quadriceps]|uniref:Sodium-coupled monocarboxylate transporter 1-like n=1 Tax=Dinoponera quadriceps TaxID=609295 RepID=A0A6P3XG30_DINQU|nr:PREDICTED: sodium-coupled monocarboxylate transporter 1-like [Dinoponera quadriceps]
MEDVLTTSVPFNETGSFDRFVFGWVDYTCFGLLLLVSVLIGLYFGIYTKQDTPIEYFLGGKRMKIFPIAMSVAISNIAGTALLGIPTEVFFYGSQFAMCILTAIFGGIITIYTLLPVFYKLQLTSVFEYLELRFNKSVRTFCSLLFTVSLFIYVPVVIYAPALVFAQVTNLNLHVITPVLCISCIIYTTIGGLKAVVWTDTMQIVVTTVGLITVLTLGVESVGGLGEMWRIAGENGRLVFFDMNPSPFVRNSFWITAFGLLGTWLGHLSIHPGMVQRYLAVPTEKDAKRGLIIGSMTIVLLQIMSVFTGLATFAKYYNCDPILTKTVKRPDQITPYYMMDVVGHLVGLPGLFIASLVSSALAVMSTNLNTISGTVYEDLVCPWLPDDMKKKENVATNCMKVISVICGMIAVGLVFMIEKLGTVFEMGLSMRAVCDGPMLGLFFLGTMVPWANAKGAMVGGSFGMVIMVWLVGGAQWKIAQGEIKHHTLPTSVEGCPYPLNETLLMATTITPAASDSNDEPMILYRISFIAFGTVGALIAIMTGTIASYFFGVDLESVDPDHIAPLMRRYVKDGTSRLYFLEMTSPMQRSLLALTVLTVIGLAIFLLGKRLALETRRRDSLLLDMIANISGNLDRLDTGFDNISAQTGVARKRLRQLVALHRENLFVCAALGRKTAARRPRRRRRFAGTR